MKRILRWLRIGLLSIVLASVLAGAIVYLLSERLLRRTYTEPAAVPRYSNADLVRIIRRAVRPDGSSVIGMPSEMFSMLTDENLGTILAYLRSVPPVGGLPPERRLG